MEIETGSLHSFAAALAQELGAALDLEGLVELGDPLVDLAEERLVASLAFRACRHRLPESTMVEKQV